MVPRCTAARKLLEGIGACEWTMQSQSTAKWFSRSEHIWPSNPRVSCPVKIRKTLNLRSGVFRQKLIRRVITSTGFPRVLGPYSHAVVSGGFVFVAGQAPINPSTQKFELGDINSETRRELINMGSILEAAGSNLAGVVKVTIHLANVDDFVG